LVLTAVKWRSVVGKPPMTNHATQPIGDPRPPPADERSSIERNTEARPLVAALASQSEPWLAIGGAVVLGLLVLSFLIARRTHSTGDVESAHTLQPAISSPALPPDLALSEAEARIPRLVATPPQTPQPLSAPPIFQPAVTALTSGGPTADALIAAQRRRAPSLVVDLGDGGGPSEGAAREAVTSRPPAGASPNGGDARVGPTQLSGDEQFSDRVGSAEPDHARATFLRDPRSVVPQGTMIPAVLETAMNSDLPGFVRAVVSRDVRGFDGSTVIIPRGSRLVGQYRSGLSQGASRIFVIWTRLLRPDGASVQIASPGGDPLGRAGQAGQVHNHFLRQFADSILLSVISAEVSNLAARPATQIVIGGAANGVVASSGSLAGVTGTIGTTNSSSGGGSAIPPTITVLQGAPISIFVARDLDFSGAVSPGK
jgi:type IV secretory pathway VirB10-like protein